MNIILGNLADQFFFRELWLVCFAPFSGNICKSQLYFDKIFKILQKKQTNYNGNETSVVLFVFAANDSLLYGGGCGGSMFFSFQCKLQRRESRDTLMSEASEARK